MSGAEAIKRPSLLLSIVAFLLAGPFIAGLVVVFFVAVIGDPNRPGFSLLRAAGFALGWFRSVFTEPAGWFLTSIPTVLAALLFWVMSRPWSSRRRASSRTLAMLTGAVKGGASATLAWVASISIPFKYDVVAATESLLFVGAIVIPTGAILGLFLNSLLPRERPNSAVYTDARNEPARAGNRER